MTTPDGGAPNPEDGGTKPLDLGLIGQQWASGVYRVVDTPTGERVDLGAGGTEAYNAIPALLSRLTAAEAERDELKRALEAAGENAAAAVAALRARAETAESRLSDALKALEPFAATAEHDIGETEADDDLFRQSEARYARAPRIVVGDLRRALAITQGDR